LPIPLPAMKLNTLLSAGLLAATGAIAEELTLDKIEADIKEDKLQNVLWNLNKIARDNGGNRAFGFPGYNASMDFILERVQTRFGKHIDSYVQPFVHLFEQTREIKVTGPDGKDVDVLTLMYNTATPVPGGVTASLVDTPVDDERGSGCFADQWEGIDATGKLALVKRGACAIADKLKLAKQAGALGVILWNQSPGTPIAATLGAENVGQMVPVAVVQLDVGEAWKERLTAGEDLEVTLLVDSMVEDRTTWNIIAETKEGDPNNVIMMGAHLDSVQQGPGVNDDGSGTAALLEMVGAFKKYKGFPNKVRFAWWGAEESGLAGSNYYGSQLSEQEADAIRFYFNYDMIGSIVPDYAVYSDTDAHKVGGSILVDYLKSKGKDAYYGEFGSDSDYVAFLELGIPSSGIFTGAGAPQDPCYHLACDTIDNIDWEAITLNAKAAARAAAQFALSTEGIPAREKVTVNPRSQKAVLRSLNKWAKRVEVLEKKHSCSGRERQVV
jgi:aminopeptidase Y